jgi:hypothetical protein
MEQRERKNGEEILVPVHFLGVAVESGTTEEERRKLIRQRISCVLAVHRLKEYE